jgi:type I restriction enzyme S subunit
MQEYRTRLTFDIVTGKLDVREAAKKLPHLPTDSDAEALIDDAFDDTESEDTEV